ncbi:MAG TPA: type II secretion system major pseudopilin GspG [Usitatibacteraceae bacterium]
MNLHRMRERGFSLIEIIIVITIIGLIVAWAGNRIFGQGDKAKAGIARSRIAELSAQLDLYKLETGRYPTSAEGLKALLQAPAGVSNWNGPYVKNADSIKDPWNNEMIYRSPGNENRAFEIISLGSDGKEGGEGVNKDINSWQ